MHGYVPVERLPYSNRQLSHHSKRDGHHFQWGTHSNYTALLVCNIYWDVPTHSIYVLAHSICRHVAKSGASHYAVVHDVVVPSDEDMNKT